MIEWASATPEVFLSFGAGCAAGYGFNIRTSLRTANRRIDELKTEVDLLRKEKNELQSKVLDMGTVFWPEHERRSKKRD